jgi:hypothetical protein
MDDIICRRFYLTGQPEPTAAQLEDYGILIDRFLALAHCRDLHEAIIQAITGLMFELSQQMRVFEAEYPAHTAVIQEFARQDRRWR